jgi:tRNA(fMet)-specific endonuclease VapC
MLEEFVAGLGRAGLRVLPYDAVAAEWHAAERARLAASGLTPPFVDGQIVAIAAVHRLVLVTSNVDDFAPFEGVEVRDWRR